jgi:hypothetical protein
MKYLFPLLMACTQPVIEPPKGVVIIEELGDTTRVWIRNDGIECYIYYDGEFIRKEKY